MKKITTLLLSMLLLGSMSMTALARETNITTTVPDSHRIEVKADGAEVFCDGQSGSRFTAERLSEPRLLIRAVSGRQITQVLLNGEDITGQIRGGYYTLEPVYEDKTLTVVTKEEPKAQGKIYTVQGVVRRDGKSLEGITVELRSKLKTAITDSSGRFTFRDVECGKHSVTAIENGRIVGYMEFVLAEGDSMNFALANGIYTVTVNNSEIGIDLMLELSEDGVLRIVNAAGIAGSQKPDSPTSPKTGDIKSLLCQSVWILIAIVIMSGYYIRKKQKNSA